MTQVVTNTRLLGEGTFDAIVERIDIEDGDPDTSKNPNGNHIWKARFVLTPEDGLGDVIVTKKMAWYGGAASFSEKIARGILGADYPQGRLFDDELDRGACEGRRVKVKVVPFRTQTGEINTIDDVMPVQTERRATRRGMMETQS